MNTQNTKTSKFYVELKNGVCQLLEINKIVEVTNASEDKINQIKQIIEEKNKIVRSK